MHTRTLVLGITLCTAPLWAACATTERDAIPHEHSKAQPTDQAEGMERMMRLATPGPNHKRLDPIVGRFKTTVKMWMEPSAPAMESKGTMENKWILDGRFVMSEYDGEAMGQPFRGMGLLGYDNAQECYVSTWCDTMGTMLTPVGQGRIDSTGKVITTTRMMDDPMTGKTMKVRDVTTIKSNNEHTYEMYAPDDNGKEFKTLEIWYTRI